MIANEIHQAVSHFTTMTGVNPSVIYLGEDTFRAFTKEAWLTMKDGAFHYGDFRVVTVRKSDHVGVGI